MYSKTITITYEFADWLERNIGLLKKMRRMDGSIVYWFDDDRHKQHKFATPRPNDSDLGVDGTDEEVKKRFRNVKGLDCNAM